MEGGRAARGTGADRHDLHLGRYLAVQISGGMIDGVRVLPEEPIRLTHRQYVEQNRTFGPFQRHGWGFGWDLGTYRGDMIVHRFGSFAGYRSHLSFMPEHGIGVVVLVNGDGLASPAADLLVTYIYDILRQNPDRQRRFTETADSLLDQYREAVAAEREVRSTRAAPLLHPLEAFAGRFENEVYGEMEWRVIGDGLEMRMGAIRSRATVFNAARNQLRIEVGGTGMVVEFSFPTSGAPATSVRFLGQTFERRK